MSSPHTQSAALVRGGRLRKTSRGIFTFAPFLATASAIALGALLSLTPTDSAHAGSCTGTAPTFTCSGAADMASDTGQTLTTTTGTLMITETNNFGLNAEAVLQSLWLRARSGANMDVTLAGDITNRHASGNGVYVYAAATSSVTTVEFTSSGTITANGDGIYSVIQTGGTNALSITANGMVSAGGEGINADHNGTGTLTITVGGTVDSTATNGTAISMSGGSNQKLVINTGGSIASGDAVTGTDATLELAAADGETTGSFDLSSLSTFTGFTTFEKSGAGTWTLTGAQPSGKAFTSASLTGGTLRFNAATLELGTNALALAANTTLEVVGANTINGNLDNTAAGAISLAIGDDTGTDDSLSVTNFTKGGTLTLNANFMTGMSDTLTITGMVTGSGATAITLTAEGTPADLLNTSSITLVDVSGSSVGADGDFTLTNSGITLTRDAGSGDWIVQGTRTPPPDTGGGGMPPPMPVMPECEESTSTMGSFTCRGAFTEGQTLAAESGESLNVTADPGFSINTDTGNALTLTGAADSTGIVVSLGGATISSTATDGIGIDADHAGSGDVTITASGAVSGGDTGIDVTHSGSGGNVSVTADDVSGGTGISAAITGTDNTAGTVSITVGGAVNATATTDAVAIEMMGGASQTLTLNTGARISGDIVANAVAADAEATTIPATLTLAGGSGSSSLNLSTLSGFSAFEKTGNGTWELTGVQGTMDGFTNANVRGGTLRLNDATLRPGDSTLTIASGAILEVMGESTVAGALSSSGAISLAVGDDGTDERLTVSGTFSGTVTMNADLSNPDSPTADQLVLNGSGSNSVTLHLRVAANEDLELTPAQLTALQNALIGGNASNVSITAGSACATTRTGSCTLTASGGNLTALTITLAAADAAVYESYAATLTELGRLSSRQQRISGRTYSPGQPVWGQIQAGNTTLEPATSSEGSVEYDLQDIRARFGFDVPLHHLQDAEIFPVTLGMNAWIAEGESDITASNGTGTLESDAFGFAATATLEQAKNSGIYADAQLQYAAFSSDMASGGSELASNQGADSFSASAEVGMRLPALHGFTLTPQVQIVWSDVEFDDFTDSKEVLVSLADGETLTARLGLAAEHALQLGELGDLAGDGIFRAAADLHLPLDGKTGIRIAEESFTSDLQEVAFSLSAGAVFSLTESATLSADLATTHGSETETYRASLTTRLAF